jgi:hypothetical protein
VLLYKADVTTIIVNVSGKDASVIKRRVSFCCEYNGVNVIPVDGVVVIL